MMGRKEELRLSIAKSALILVALQLELYFKLVVFVGQGGACEINGTRNLL